MILILVKFFMVFTLLFFSYVINLAIKERQQFFNSTEYKSASLFEKVVLNTISFFGISFFLLMLISYLIFIFT